MAITWSEIRPGGIDANRQWCIDVSSDGTKMIAGSWLGRLWTSTDSGVNWTERRPIGDSNKTWSCVAISDNGAIMWAAENNGRLYKSTDSGANWSEVVVDGNPFDRNWISIAIDSDSSHIIVARGNAGIYVSTNSGSTWTDRQQTSYATVDCSEDGSVMIQGSIVPGRFYVSTNSGTNWTERQPTGGATNAYWSIASCSDDGSVIYAGRGGSTGSGGRLYVSTNTGVNWSESPLSSGYGTDSIYYDCCLNSNASKALISWSGNQISRSENSGANWTQDYPGVNSRYVLGCDSNFSVFLAGANYGTEGRLYLGSLASPITFIPRITWIN